jgi:hypothetical protein
MADIIIVIDTQDSFAGEFNAILDHVHTLIFTLWQMNVSCSHLLIDVLQPGGIAEKIVNVSASISQLCHASSSM